LSLCRVERKRLHGATCSFLVVNILAKGHTVVSLRIEATGSAPRNVKTAAGIVQYALLAIARIFTDEHEYARARERIREALPLADASGLVNVVASLALLWAEIDLAEGKTSSAATWLVTARDKFAQSEDLDGVARARHDCSTGFEHPQNDRLDIQRFIELVRAAECPRPRRARNTDAKLRMRAQGYEP